MDNLWIIYGIGANSDPAGFVHSFKCITTRNSAFSLVFFCFHLSCSTLHVSFCSTLPNEIWALHLVSTAFYIYTTSSSHPLLFRPSFFVLLHPLSSVLVLFCCQLCQLLFHLTFVIVSPSVTPHITL